MWPLSISRLNSFSTVLLHGRQCACLDHKQSHLLRKKQRWYLISELEKQNRQKKRWRSNLYCLLRRKCEYGVGGHVAADCMAVDGWLQPSVMSLLVGAVCHMLGKAHFLSFTPLTDAVLWSLEGGWLRSGFYIPREAKSQVMHHQLSSYENIKWEGNVSEVMLMSQLL